MAGKGRKLRQRISGVSTPPIGWASLDEEAREGIDGKGGQSRASSETDAANGGAT